MRIPTRPLLGVFVAALVAACGDGSPMAPESPVARSTILARATTTGFVDGAAVPDLSAFDVNGVSLSLSDFSGSYLLLEVGGGWCFPSRFIAPFLPVVEAALVGDGVPFASVSVLIEASAPGVVSDGAFAQAWLATFYGGAYRPVLHMNGDPALWLSWAEAAIVPYNAIPMLFLIGPDGIVLRTQVGASSSAEELEAWVREGIAQGAAPRMESISGPTDPVAVGAPVTVTGTWSAADDDQHSGTIDWGDGTVDPLIVSADGTWASPAHSYADIGFYRIEATISDDAGASDSAVLDDVLVVDPDGGFVVGAGTVLSPAGSCLQCDDTIESEARFRLLSRYRKGASVPSGDFVFRFESGAFAFESTAQEWLMVNRAGARAQVKGVGRIVDGPLADLYPVELHFMAWLDDGAPDGLALRIWMDDPNFGEEEIYDSFGSLPLETGNVLVNEGR